VEDVDRLEAQGCVAGGGHYESVPAWADTSAPFLGGSYPGPEALSFDIDFPAAQTHLYGLPEHAAPLSLPATRGPGAHFSDPYRLFNVDIFEYLADSAMSMYGAIPLVHAHSTHVSLAERARTPTDPGVGRRPRPLGERDVGRRRAAGGRRRKRRDALDGRIGHP
jgi:hypothetical protein